MNDPAREVQALREKLSRLSEASLRLNESLDYESVLQGVVDSACALTSAGYGGMTVLDESGNYENFLSHGFTPEEIDQLWGLPDGVELFNRFIIIPQPMRHGNLRSYAESLGLSIGPLQLNSFVVVPMRHRGTHVGSFFLANKEGAEEFPVEDEEVLVMFAAQAALVISNARRYRDERRTRADLQTLIDTSPVGVVVFDAKSGAPKSFNREAVRIIESLNEPGFPVEDLPGLLKIRRADGREVSFQELSVAQTMSAGEVVRAEEVVLQAPDGRTVTTLLNATPIFSNDGEVESFVITIQDMTPLEELERLRAEFVGMVSHELRVPLTSIKGSAATVLTNPSVFGSTEVEHFFRIIDEQADRMSGLLNDLVDVARIEAGALSVSAEPVEVAVLLDEARKAFLSGRGGAGLDTELQPDLPRVMADRRRVVQVLCNLLENASTHSPEGSDIRVNAALDDVDVAFSVVDDGVGMTADRLPHVFKKFYRMDGGDRASGIAGSGLNLAICKGIVETHGGRIWAESDGPGMGARFTFTLPIVEEDWHPETNRGSSLSRNRMRPRTRVLAVDDDPLTRRHVRDALTGAGYIPMVTADPEQALRLVEERRPHLALLELKLPGADGVDLMKDILEIAKVPIIFLAPYGQDDVVAMAFDTGADDCIVKPFSPTELAARVRAALRRREVAELPEPSEPYRLGDVTIDYAERSVMLAGSPVSMTPLEYRLLVELSANAGRTLTYERLLHRVWDVGRDGDMRPMRTAIKRLRNVLGDDAKNPTLIFTEPRVGYRMQKAEEPKETQE